MCEKAKSTDTLDRTEGDKTATRNIQFTGLEPADLDERWTLEMKANVTIDGVTISL